MQTQSNAEYYMYTRIRGATRAPFNEADLAQYNASATKPVTIDDMFKLGYICGSNLSTKQSFWKLINL